MDKTWRQNDADSVDGPKLCGEKVRELLKGKYEVIPKTKEHIKVDQETCIGCQLCYITCPTGSYEMEDGKGSLEVRHGVVLGVRRLPVRVPSERHRLVVPGGGHRHRAQVELMPKP